MSIEGSPAKSPAETREAQVSEIDRLITNAWAAIQQENFEAAREVLLEIQSVGEDLDLDTKQINDIAEVGDAIENEQGSEMNTDEGDED